MATARANDWEKCARLFLLNSPAQLRDLSALLEQVLTNILTNRDEEKFRVVKTSNKTINSRIISRNGGLEFLLAAGFVAQADESGGKILKFAENALDVDAHQPLLSAVEWLKNTVSSCVDLHASKVAVTDDDAPCCECVIQLRLPTGATASGGFMRGDTLQDVRDFAACYFHPDRYL